MSEDLSEDLVENLPENLVEDVLSRIADETAEEGTALARELVRAHVSQNPATALLAAEEIGRNLSDTGQSAATVVRLVSGIIEWVEGALHPYQPDSEQRRTYLCLMKDVLEAAVAAHEQRLSGRRDAWLAFYAHEMRNALNTMMNAIWLLRQGEGTQVPRICEIADRALGRLESQINETRRLERSLPRRLPPGPAGKRIAENG